MTGYEESLAIVHFIHITLGDVSASNSLIFADEAHFGVLVGLTAPIETETLPRYPLNTSNFVAVHAQLQHFQCRST